MRSFTLYFALVIGAVLVHVGMCKADSPRTSPVFKAPGFLDTQVVKQVSGATLPEFVAEDWKLVFSDEFSSTSCPGGSPDPNKWGFEHGFVRNHELQWYQSENAKCNDGILTISAEKVSPNPATGNASYTSASILTKGLHEIKYGRFEMRAQVDVRAGSWPAWWTLGADETQFGWPKCGEIDIMEYYRSLMHGNIMFADSSSRTHWSTKTITVDATWGAQWHNWTMLWDQDSVNLYLDGKLMNSVLSRTAGTAGTGINPFQQPVYMILNQAIGGTNGGDPSKTKFPIKFLVDYIRVYQPITKPTTQQECMRDCATHGALGCCEWWVDTGFCHWLPGAHVNGGAKVDSKEAANCYSSGRCDGWNSNEECSL